MHCIRSRQLGEQIKGKRSEATQFSLGAKFLAHGRFLTTEAVGAWTWSAGKCTCTCLKCYGSAWTPGTFGRRSGLSVRPTVFQPLLAESKLTRVGETICRLLVNVPASKVALWREVLPKLITADRTRDEMATQKKYAQVFVNKLRDLNGGQFIVDLFL